MLSKGCADCNMHPLVLKDHVPDKGDRAVCAAKGKQTCFQKKQKRQKTISNNVTSSQNQTVFPCIIKKNKRSFTMAKKKAAVSIRECVACGCCIKVCPRNAITVPGGIHAVVNRELCVGCGKCVKECPASIISLEVTEE